MGKIRKQLFALLMSGVFAIIGSLYPLVVNASEPPKEEWNWTYGYTGTEQVFTVPYSGIYQFEIYGAQGGSASDNEGGKGGKITATVALSRNEEITICVGGTNGYNGGGAGTVSSGGGATDVRKDGKDPGNRILVAGGGGGANQTYPGGNGGTDTSTTVIGSGEGENSTEGAGGGGGYEGGASGTEHIVAHTHTAYGGSCYAPDYHSHTGNESEYGGCYTVPKQRTETITTNYIWTRGHETDRGTFSGDVVVGESHVPSNYHWVKYACTDQYGHTATLTYIYWCSESSARQNAGTWRLEGSRDYTDSGRDVEFDQTNYGTDWNQLWDTFTTQKTEETTVTYYDLGCGLATGSITGYHLDCSVVYDEYNVKQSTGGTNYYKEKICGNVVSEAGVRTGNGVCSIKLLSLYNLYYNGTESLNVYYEGIKVKKVYYSGSLIYCE